MAYQHPKVWHDSLVVMRLCQAMFALKPIHDDLSAIDDFHIRDAVHAIGTVRHQWLPGIRHEDDRGPSRIWSVSGTAMNEFLRVLGEMRTAWMEQELVQRGYPKNWLFAPPERGAAAGIIDHIHRTTPPVDAAFDAYVERQAA